MMLAETWIALGTLAMLEIVLGVDNIVFLAIMASRLPRDKRKLAYRVGLLGALSTRLLLLFTLSFIMGLVEPWFTILGFEVSGRTLILIVGGLFLMGKSAHEVFESVEGHGDDASTGDGKKETSFAWTIAQIMLIDIVFSLDSVITAVGMAQQVWVMATAMVIAVGVMLVFANSVGDFVNRHPSMKVLALSFLMLIGVLLVAEGFGQHVEKGYVYFAMGFALLVEMLNIRRHKKTMRVPALPPAMSDGDDASPAANDR
jgi:predicted tellurium resistance membrane protein TerC